jgi:hypothetical protein
MLHSISGKEKVTSQYLEAARRVVLRLPARNITVSKFGKELGVGLVAGWQPDSDWPSVTTTEIDNVILDSALLVLR